MKTQPSYVLIKFALALIACITLVACDEGKGVTPAGSPLNPSIGDLAVSGSRIIKPIGGILSLSCSWTNPESVYSAVAYLAHSTTLIGAGNSPTGVLASGTVPATPRIGEAIRTGFMQEFGAPLLIPTAVSSTDSKGYWSVQVPFPASITFDAPVGKNQMLLWMVLNGRKSNTLAFEMEFVASAAVSTANRRTD